MYDDDGWAVRGYPSKLPVAATDEQKLLLKRSVLIVTVPKDVIP
jgi:hypothetical protein